MPCNISKTTRERREIYINNTEESNVLRRKANEVYRRQDMKKAMYVD